MIRILTDSASDILPAEAEQLGVTVIPLNVTLEDGSILRDGIDMTPTEYYAHLASNYASLFTYLMNGLVVFHIGIPCAVSNILGNLLGSHFALKKGARFIRPMMLVVLVLLLGKLISDAVL